MFGSKKKTQITLNLEAYIAYLLLSDPIRESHKTKFLAYLSENKPKTKNAIELAALAFHAIENIAEELGAKHSVLNAEALIWNFDNPEGWEKLET